MLISEHIWVIIAYNSRQTQTAQSNYAWPDRVNIFPGTRCVRRRSPTCSIPWWSQVSQNDWSHQASWGRQLPHIDWWLLAIQLYRIAWISTMECICPESLMRSSSIIMMLTIFLLGNESTIREIPHSIILEHWCFTILTISKQKYI